MNKVSRIMVVDDEAMTASFIAYLLKGHGYGITGIANSGPKALMDAVRDRPDLVIMDINLNLAFDSDLPTIYCI